MSLLHPATIRLPARGSLLTGTGARSAQVHQIPAPCSLSPCGMCVGPPLELGSVSSLSSLLVHNLNPSPSSTALSFVQNFASPACSDEAFRQCSFNLEISSSSFALLFLLICGCPVSQVGLVASLALLYKSHRNPPPHGPERRAYTPIHILDKAFCPFVRKRF